MNNVNYGKLITYELLVLFRALPKNELKPIIKRTADTIFNKGGLIRQLNNLGVQNIPYKMSIHGMVYKQAHYFMYEFHVPPTSIEELKDEWSRDIDIIRPSIYKKNEPINFQCTLDEELQPAPYRKEVQELLELAKKKKKKKGTVEYSSGLGYYPFQK